MSLVLCPAAADYKTLMCSSNALSSMVEKSIAENAWKETLKLQTNVVWKESSQFAWASEVTSRSMTKVDKENWVQALERTCWGNLQILVDRAQDL